MVAYAFNAQQFEPKYSGGGGLPPGKYKGRIVDTRQEPTKDGRGGYLAIDLTPIEGPLVGQIQTDRLNLHNASAQAVEIANKQLSAYCHVTGQYVIQDTRQLHDIPFIFEIKPQKNNPEYTEVFAIWDINGNEPGKAGAGPAPNPVYAPPPVAAPPPQGGWPAQPPGAAPGGPGNGGGWPAQPPAPTTWAQGSGAAPGSPPWGAR